MSERILSLKTGVRFPVGLPLWHKGLRQLTIAPATFLLMRYLRESHAALTDADRTAFEKADVARQGIVNFRMDITVEGWLNVSVAVWRKGQVMARWEGKGRPPKRCSGPGGVW